MLLPWIDFMIVSLESLNHENMEHEKLLEQCFTKLFSLTLSQMEKKMEHSGWGAHEPSC